MAFSLIMSARAINIMDYCVADLDAYHFDSINAPLLLEKLIFEEESHLMDYLYGEGLPEDEEDQVLTYTHMYLKARQRKLLITTDGKTASDKDCEADDATFYAQFDAFYSYKDEKGKVHKYGVDEEVSRLLTKVSNICVSHKIKCIEPVHIMSAMFSIDCQELKDFFMDLGFNYNIAKNYFTSDAAIKANVIPPSLMEFLTCLNDRINPKLPCEILMRDMEVEQIWNISLKKNKRNTVIVGEAGVGKSALIEKITYDIVKGTCPPKFKGFSVISLDVNSLIAGTTYRGQAEERIHDLIEFLEERDDVILFIDEVHTILGAGSCYEGEMDLSNALKPILARGDTIVIGATTMEEYERYFKRDAALTRRFETVIVDEPLSNRVYPMIKNKIRVLSNHHNVKITRSMVEYIIMIANCFSFEKRNPDKTLDLIDRSMVVAYRTGKKYVDKKCVLANFNIFFELFEGMGEDARKEIAYHEVGHYIVGKMSKRLVNLNMLAISIMPAEEYLGVTVYEQKKDRIPRSSKEYYIDLLAFNLGGRVAEKMYTKEATSGASEDLKNATVLAYDAVAKFGFSGENAERNSIFLNTEAHPMLSEKYTNMLNEEIESLINLGYRRAEEILCEHQELLKMLVRKLLVKQIMSEQELDKVWQQYFEKRQLTM